MNKNEFFTKASLCICSSLDIEKGLFCLLEYLKEHMPVTQMYLERWDESVKSTRTVAVIKEDGGKRVNLLTPLSGESGKWASGFLIPKEQKVFLFDDPWGWCLAKDMMTFHGISLNALILLPLETGGKITGSLILGAEGSNQFTQKQAEMIQTLSEILALAMSNTLQYQNEVKLAERDFFWESTKRICGNLNIEEGLFELHTYLRSYMPVAEMLLQYYEPSERSMRTIATAREDGYRKTDILTPLSGEAIDKINGTPPDMEAIFLDDPESFSVTRDMSEGHDEKPTAAIILFLDLDQDLHGYLAFTSEYPNILTDEHKEWINLLKGPMSIAMTNTLRYRDEVKLFERNFFWEVTKRICGDLEIEKGLQSCAEYLSEHIPLDSIYLERYDYIKQSLCPIARATGETGEALDIEIPLSDDSRSAMEGIKHSWLEGNLPPVIVINDPENEPVTKDTLKALGEPVSSVMSMPLFLSSSPIGTLVVLAEGNNRFEEKHASLLEIVKGPFGLAMSNTLKHRNELRLFNRDFFFEVTRRICGNLEIEKGLHECFLYITQQLPGYKMYLERFDREFESMLLVAQADQDKGEKLDQMIPLDKEAMESIKEFADLRRKGELPSVIILNKPDEEPIIRCMMQARNEPASSVLLLPLVIGDRHLGTVALLAEGEDRFSQEHADLFAVLREPFFVAMSNTLKHREVLQLKDMLADDNRFLHQELHRISGDEIVGAGYGLKDTMHKIEQVASLDSPVLLLGETGVGKDVIANYIHYSSPRSKNPFVSVNCGAIPESLIDSELFGHEKGAFTGALSQKRGRFERADKGTIFLDEIGELPPQAQVRLLRVLQQKEFERVGGTKTISVDIRIVAATNRDLNTMVENGDFREDLWFRLNVFPVTIPPLRERAMDIPALLQHFIAEKSKEMKLHTMPQVAPGEIDRLIHYSWPGNVRELQNIVERALILSPNGPLVFSHITGPVSVQVQAESISSDDIVPLDDAVAVHIRKALKKSDGKIHGKGGAAELLNINPNTLRNRMNKLGIKYRKTEK